MNSGATERVIAYLERQTSFQHVGGIARNTGCSAPTVRKAIAVLEARGRIEVTSRLAPEPGDGRRVGARGYRVKPLYKVRASRWEHGLELHIEGVGVTQSFGLDDAEEMARDLIATRMGVPKDSFAVEIVPERM